MMVIGGLLDTGSIAPRVTASTKRAALAVVSEIAARCFGLKAAKVLDALLEREATMPTGVGKGIAVPHAQVQGLTHMRAVFVRLETPVEFGAVDDEPVDMIFALLAPPGAGSDQLRRHWPGCREYCGGRRFANNSASPAAPTPSTPSWRRKSRSRQQLMKSSATSRGQVGGVGEHAKGRWRTALAPLPGGACPRARASRSNPGVDPPTAMRKGREVEGVLLNPLVHRHRGEVVGDGGGDR